MILSEIIWYFSYTRFFFVIKLITIINKIKFRVLQILEIVSSRYIEISNKINQKKKGRKNSALKRNKVRLNLSSFGQKNPRSVFFLKILP